MFDPEDITKYCKGCDVIKPISEFYSRLGKLKTGYRTTCKLCNKNEQIRMKQEFPDRWHQYHIKSKYNINIEVYNNLVKIQNNECAICYQSQENKRLYIDHDHISGKIRGLLCQKCNSALGLFNDCEQTITQALNYLKSNYNG